MKIKDLTPEKEKLYCMCLEDWSDEIKEAGNHKELWYAANKSKGLRVKLSEDEKGNTGGMIQYLPIEESAASGSDLYFVNCIWVHGYKQGRGNFQKSGMGKALLKAAEEDVKALGAKGLVTWGISLPFWMKASWFKKHGYKKVDKIGIQELLWKPFSEDAMKPCWIRPARKPETEKDKVTVTAFINGWCPAQNLVYERAKRAAEKAGEKVIFRRINTSDRKVFLDWGIMDALYVDKKAINTGPPPSYNKLLKIIEKRVKKLK